MLFQAKQGSQNRFCSNKCFQEEVSTTRCPSKVPSKLVPKQYFQEEVPKQGSQPQVPRNRCPHKVPKNRFTSKVPRKRFPSNRLRGSQARFPGRGSHARVPSCSWKFCLGTSSSWERLLGNLFLQALSLLGTLRRNGSWDLAWERFLGTVLASGS